MPFKINISDKGKTHKVETENESLIGKKIGETIQGKDISEDLTGYELEITGTSDNSGHPGFKGLEGTAYHRKVLKYGPGMHDRRKGIRLKRIQRGEEISLKTIQINTKVKKHGDKKFEELGSGSEEPKVEEKPVKEEEKEESKTENAK